MYASIGIFVYMIVGWPIWSTKAPLPQPLAGSGCAVVNDTIYVIGGRDSPGNCYAANYAYDPYNNTWTVKASMPTPRGNLGCAAVNGKIYAIGGWVGATATGAVEEYNPVTDIWTTKTPMPTQRYTLGMATVGNKIYVIGGMNMQGQVFNTVEEYNPLTDTWATKTPMPTPRMGPGCAAVYDTIYVYGGSTVIGGGVTTVNECYDPVTDTWATRASLPTARYALGGIASNHYVYAIGGYDYWNYHANLDQYAPMVDIWETQDPMQYGRQSTAVGLIGDYPYFIYVIGGWNNGALNYNEEAWFGDAIEEYSKPQPAVSFDISPNPFTHATEIRCSLLPRHASQGEAGDSRFSIQKPTMNVYDATGRVVKSFDLESSIQNKESSLVWDGNDNNGRALPNGVYLIVYKDNGIAETERLVLVR